MDFRKKYGQWAMVLGATEGIGKACSFEYARRGMDVILVGRRKEALEVLAEEIKKETQKEVVILPQDLADDNAAEILIKETQNLDMGLVNYVACLHTMGKYYNTDYSVYEKMRKVNTITFSKLLHHFVGAFAERDRGAFVTIGSLSGWTSLPYCAEYAADKAYMMALTEGVAYEMKNTNVDVLLLTAGSTITPTWLENKPSDPKQVASAMYPADVAREGLDQLGNKMSYLVGEGNRESYKETMMKERDEMIEDLGKMFNHMA